jgi:phage tail-like protein
MSPVGDRVDPFGNFNFLVEIDGIARAAFHECSGLESRVQVIEHREGGALTATKLAGMTTYSNIVLRRGVTNDTELYDWHVEATRGNIQRRNGSIVMLDARGQETRRWNFFEAWPATWTGPSLNSEGNDVAIESLELAHERLERE